MFEHVLMWRFYKWLAKRFADVCGIGWNCFPCAGRQLVQERDSQTSFPRCTKAHARSGSLNVAAEGDETSAARYKARVVQSETPQMDSLHQLVFLGSEAMVAGFGVALKRVWLG